MKRTVLSFVLIASLLPAQGVVVRRRVVSTGGTTPAYSTSCLHYNSGTTTPNCGPMTVPANGAVSCFFFRAGAANTIPTSVSDGTNSYALQGQVNLNNSNGTIALYTFFDTAGGSRTVTANYAVGSNMIGACTVHTGVTTFDKYATGGGTGGQGGTNRTTTSTGSPQGLTAANEALVGFGIDNDHVFTFGVIPAAWNIRQQHTTGFYAASLVEQVVSSATGSTVGSGSCASANCTGGTVTGSSGQYCTLTFNVNGGGSAATGIINLNGTNTIGAGTQISITNPGTGYTSAPTQATLGTGTATCSGTATVSTLIGYSAVFTGATTGDSTGAMVGTWK